MRTTALTNGIHSVQRALRDRRRRELEAPHHDHDGPWWSCPDAACQRSWEAYGSSPRIDEDTALDFSHIAGDAELLAMRNVGRRSLAALRAWASSGPTVPNWVGEGVPA